jgi:hypothetical protein
LVPEDIAKKSMWNQFVSAVVDFLWRCGSLFYPIWTSLEDGEITNIHNIRLVDL